MNLIKKISKTFVLVVVSFLTIFIAGCEDPSLNSTNKLETPVLRTTSVDGGFYVFAGEVTNADQYYVRVYSENQEELLNTFNINENDILKGYKILKPEGTYYICGYASDSTGTYSNSEVSTFIEVEVTKTVTELETYSITYILNGGILPESAKTSYYEGEVYQLPIPTKDNATFTGWYLDASCTGEKITTTSTGDLVIYAGYESNVIVDSYTITYVLNGGSISVGAASSYQAGETIILEIPSKSNATFGGWYLNANFSGEEISVISNTTKGNLVLYAKWEDITTNYTGYYKDASGKTGTALKQALRTIISTGVKTVTYDDLRSYLQYTDEDPNDSSKLLLVYSHASVKATWDGGNTWNREHVWPKSLGWYSESGAGSDIHHIRPEDPKVNSTRGNKPFGEVSGGKALTFNGQTVGYYDSRFEPMDEFKGDVARIILYMLVRYSQTDSSYPVTRIFTSMNLLLEWHELDPVSEFELVRNQRCYEKQNNYNPFIDHPEFARMIWG